MNECKSTLTDAGRAAIDRAFAEYNTENSDSLNSILESHLGGKRVHHYRKIPSNNNGNVHIDGPDGREYILKYCNGFHSSEEKSPMCSIQAEAHVWETAKQRGDSELFAPIIAYGTHRSGRHWEIMVWGGGITEAQGLGLEHLSTYVAELNTEAIRTDEGGMTFRMESELQERGWEANDIGGEVKEIDNKPVVVDYEVCYPPEISDFENQDTENVERLREWAERDDTPP